MKANWKFCLLPCLLFSLSTWAAPGGPDYASRYFSFDNGQGLRGSSTEFLFDSRHGDLLSQIGAPVSQFFVHRDFSSAATLHYGGTVAEDEHHYYGGVSLGSATVAYVAGNGDSFSKAPDALYQDLDPYFFYGGSRSSFNFQGLSADVGLRAGLSTQLAFTTVTGPGVTDRHGYYLGAAGRHLKAGFFQLDRGGDRVGRGMNLEWSGRSVDLQYQEIRSVYGADVRRLAFDWSPSPRQGFSVALEQAHNDSFAGDDDQRIMFRFTRRLGRSPVFNAAEGAGSGNGKTFGRAVGIGVGLGIAALAVSSGSSGNDGAQRFTVRNDAAFTILNRINPISVRQNLEHGGWIYRNADNTFGYTDPVTGTIASVNIGNPVSSVPTGTVASASYHTHGGPDPRYDNEHFSPQDILADDVSHTDGYLGTPAGYMKLHDYRTGSITVVRRIAN